MTAPPGKHIKTALLRKSTGRSVMSMHPSFKQATKIKTRRNVLKRFERVKLLKKRGEWEEGDRAFGLRKTRPEE